MNDDAMSAEAVAVKDGRIIAVGTVDEVMAHKGDDTQSVDLDGRTMLPGFVDSHGHVVLGGIQALSANLLTPPDGNVTDIASLQETLRKWADDNKDAVKKVNLIVGFGYDNASLAELRHPTREDLDAISTDIPIYLVHQSGHFGAANSKALEFGGITSQTSDPPGGIIRRDSNGEPDGVLEETAHFPVLAKLMGQLGPNGFETFARAGAELWARFGYTTAQEGRSMPDLVKIMRKVGSEGGFKIDVVTYPDVLIDKDFIKENVRQTYVNRVRVGGAKLTIDGSPQGCAVKRQTVTRGPVAVYPPGYSGYQAATDEQVIDSIA